ITYETFPEGIFTLDGFTPTTRAVIVELLLNFLRTVSISLVDIPGAYDRNLMLFAFKTSSIFFVPAFSYWEKITTFCWFFAIRLTCSSNILVFLLFPFFSEKL